MSWSTLGLAPVSRAEIVRLSERACLAIQRDAERKIKTSWDWYHNARAKRWVWPFRPIPPDQNSAHRTSTVAWLERERDVRQRPFKLLTRAALAADGDLLVDVETYASLLRWASKAEQGTTPEAL